MQCTPTTRVVRSIRLSILTINGSDFHPNNEWLGFVEALIKSEPFISRYTAQYGCRATTTPSACDEEGIKICRRIVVAQWPAGEAVFSNLHLLLRIGLVLQLMKSHIKRITRFLISFSWAIPISQQSDNWSKMQFIYDYYYFYKF